MGGNLRKLSSEQRSQNQAQKKLYAFQEAEQWTEIEADGGQQCVGVIAGPAAIAWFFSSRRVSVGFRSPQNKITRFLRSSRQNLAISFLENQMNSLSTIRCLWFFTGDSRAKGGGSGRRNLQVGMARCYRVAILWIRKVSPRGHDTLFLASQ